MGPESGDAADDELKVETLSLSNFSNSSELGELAVPGDLGRKQLADSFEFFSRNEFCSDMCPADDIIDSGKLLPLNSQPLRRPDPKCRRSESLSELNSATRSDSFKTRVVRSSRSLDDRRRGRSHSSLVPELERHCSGKSDTSSSKVPKSRWQLLISGIGMVKFPPEMELRDIKNRQSRRSNPATLFSGSEAKSPASGSNGWRGSSWGLIEALSCKDHTSISVTASFSSTAHCILSGADAQLR